MAISHFKDSSMLTAAEWVLYGKEFKIGNWIEGGCAEIVRQDVAISKESAIMFGFDTTFELFTLRERRIQGTLGSDFRTIIRDALKDELDRVRCYELECRTDEDKALAREEFGCDDKKTDPFPISTFIFNSPSAVSLSGRRKKKR